MPAEMVKMSAKGQLVVPQQIRQEEYLNEGDIFIPFAIKEGVLFKRIEKPDFKSEFQKISKDVQKRFKQIEIKEDVIKEAILWARKK